MTRASRSSRVVLVALVALTTIGVSVWRTALGLHYLPGLFTVVFVPLSVAGFIALDLYVGFSLAEWVAVCGLVMAHLVLSVPVLPKPLYYVGGHIVRPDHFVHVFAGGLVAWLSWDVIARKSPESASVALASVILALAFGVLKETTDYLSVRASGLNHDLIDTSVDLAGNAVGAVVVVMWRLKHPGRRTSGASPAGREAT